jgi:hypothetical protein
MTTKAASLTWVAARIVPGLGDRDVADADPDHLAPGEMNRGERACL